jgi:quercetin dioxygenase-like cupin family protein
MSQEKKKLENRIESRLIQPGEGHRLAIAGGIYTIKAAGKDTDGAYAMVEMLVPPQTGPPPHMHSREVESFYILEGSLSFWLDNQKFTCAAGCLVIAPPGLPHSFKNEGDTPARALALITPAGLEKFFEAVGSPINEGSAGPEEGTPEALERVIATAPKYGIEIKLP